jgi:hypothetical protein
MTEKWTASEIADRFEEAIYTLKRLPKPKVQGYHNMWPPIVYTTWELLAQEKKPFRLGPPLPKAIDRMEQTFVWIGWLEEDERKMVWLRAARLPWRVICARFGVCKNTAAHRWTVALVKIAHRLNRESPKAAKRKVEERRGSA